MEQELVNVKKISTKDNPTDMLTKPTPKVKFKQCLNLINVGSYDSDNKKQRGINPS